jgi:hypothetical protein
MFASHWSKLLTKPHGLTRSMGHRLTKPWACRLTRLLTKLRSQPLCRMFASHWTKLLTKPHGLTRPLPHRLTAHRLTLLSNLIQSRTLLAIHLTKRLTKPQWLTRSLAHRLVHNSMAWPLSLLPQRLSGRFARPPDEVQIVTAYHRYNAH